MTTQAATVSSSKYRMAPGDLRMILVLLIAAFVVILNETIMNAALPSLMVELGVRASTVQWLSTALLLTMPVLIATTGFVLQAFSPRPSFTAALALFVLATLIA